MQWSEVGCVWAPETMYDYETGHLLVHFTTRMKGGTNMIYYIYMNDDFTKMISDPKLLFEAPLNNNGVPAYNVIDSDIIKVGDTYHLFYVSHEHMATVKHATSTNVTSPFVIDDKYDDGEKHAAVAPFTVKEAKTLEKCWEKRKQ